jgi:hypothetical protein
MHQRHPGARHVRSLHASALALPGCVASAEPGAHSFASVSSWAIAGWRGTKPTWGVGTRTRSRFPRDGAAGQGGHHMFYRREPVTRSTSISKARNGIALVEADLPDPARPGSLYPRLAINNETSKQLNWKCPHRLMACDIPAWTVTKWIHNCDARNQTYEQDRALQNRTISRS